ncbi:MAG: hypothetical protein ACRDZP_09915, partial [Acidimicrobiales bacterium]
MLPDVTGIDRTFHYSCQKDLEVGAIVRVLLHNRRVRGWAVATGTPAPPGVEPQPIIEVVSLGPPPHVVDLCGWAAWRFAGRRRPLLIAASPERVVRSLPASGTEQPLREAAPPLGVVTEAVALGDAVIRLPPGAPRLPVVQSALFAMGEAALGSLVLVESRGDAERLAAELRRSGWPIALYPDEWAAAAVPRGVVIGTRNAALSPRTPSLTLVLDAHSESYRSERVPNFDARVIAAERARRSGQPVVFVTPCPSVELLAGRPLVTFPERDERAGWGEVRVLDSREEDPAEGGYPSRLAGLLKEAAEGSRGRPVVCVLNRTGRARLLSCSSCRDVMACARCGAGLIQREKPPRGELAVLSCPRCGDEQPALCGSCGSSRLSVLRSGVKRAREQLGALTGLEVGEVSGRRSAVPAVPLIVGTEAVLHRVASAALVAFLDFDQELLAPRFRAAEQALVLLARAVRIVGASRGNKGVIVRTSAPGHEVVRAATTGDPGIVARAERARREELSLPPFSALASVTGDGAGALCGLLGPGVDAAPVGDGRYLLRAGRA